MTTFRPDPTFYATPTQAAEAPPEELLYVALPNPAANRADAIGVVDCAPGSRSYGRLIAQVDMPNLGDELHHFGWNACSTSLCPWAPHPHIERRYLIVPGINSSRIHVLDTKSDPRKPEIIKVIEPDVLARRTNYASPHSVHCGPDGIYVSALGAPDGEGPGGMFILDHDTFEPTVPWERNRGSQRLAYDFAWHLGFDRVVTSEWGTPNMVRSGVNPELLLAGKYGNALHVWDLRRGRHLEQIDLGPQYQMTLELRAARDPRRAYGFVGVVISLEDLSSSIWLWHRSTQNDATNAGGDERGQVRGEWRATKVIDIPAEPANAADLPPLLQGFGAVPPLVTDINLSLDDRKLYVSCWGTGELRQYDVSDPFRPKLTGTVQIGGIVRRAGHPARTGQALTGGPQMVELSRDGRRIYLTNGLYSPWDEQFYPEGIRGWLVKLDARPEGGMAIDPAFLLETDAGVRAHQVRLQGGDASSDSFCFGS